MKLILDDRKYIVANNSPNLPFVLAFIIIFIYLNNLKDQGIKYSFIVVDDGDYSPIRNLPRVEMQNGLLNARQLNLFEEVLNV